jgi:hypothetical protein
MFVSKIETEEVRGQGGKLNNEELHNVNYSSQTLSGESGGKVRR